jgi:hypothetical protein
MIDHCPEGAADGSQGLRSNPWEIHESVEHPEGMRDEICSRIPSGCGAGLRNERFIILKAIASYSEESYAIKRHLLGI